jgi:hypothetical protein
MCTIGIERNRRAIIGSTARHPREIAYHSVISIMRSDCESDVDISHSYGQILVRQI